MLQRDSFVRSPLLLAGLAMLGLGASGCQRQADVEDECVDTERGIRAGVEGYELGTDERRTTETIAMMRQLHQIEIDRGELARREGLHEAVRAYADQVVRDHRHASQRLTALAERLPVFVPPTQSRHASLGELLDARGIELDRKYLHATIDAHDRSITRLMEAQRIVSRELAHHIGTVLPIMIQHRALGFNLLSHMPTA